MVYLDTYETPEALRRWADRMIGKPARENSKRIIAGWRWDGKSPTIVVMTAPRGMMYIDIPLDIWRRVQTEQYAIAI